MRKMGTHYLCRGFIFGRNDVRNRDAHFYGYPAPLFALEHPRPIARLPSRKIIFGALVHMWISGRDGITLPSWPESDAAVVLSHNRATRLRELGPIDRLRPPHYYSHLTHAPKPASYLPAVLIRWRSLVRHFVAFSNFFLHYFLQVRYPPQSPCGVAAHALSKRG